LQKDGVERTAIDDGHIEKGAQQRNERFHLAQVIGARSGLFGAGRREYLYAGSSCVIKGIAYRA
jgi:hypothetical protein